MWNTCWNVQYIWGGDTESIHTHTHACEQWHIATYYGFPLTRRAKHSPLQWLELPRPVVSLEDLPVPKPGPLIGCPRFPSLVWAEACILPGKAQKTFTTTPRGHRGQALLGAALASHAPGIPHACGGLQRPLGVIPGVFSTVPGRTQSDICARDKFPCCSLEAAGLSHWRGTSRGKIIPGFNPLFT